MNAEFYDDEINPDSVNSCNQRNAEAENFSFRGNNYNSNDNENPLNISDDGEDDFIENKEQTMRLKIYTSLMAEAEEQLK